MLLSCLGMLLLSSFKNFFSLLTILTIAFNMIQVLFILVVQLFSLLKRLIVNKDK